jgi:hypothetical protein
MHRLGGWRAAPACTLHCNTQTPGAVQEPPCTHSAYAHVPAQRARLAQQTHTQHWHWHKHAHPIGSHPTRGIGSYASRECARSATAHANPNKPFTCGLFAIAKATHKQSMHMHAQVCSSQERALPETGLQRQVCHVHTHTLPSAGRLGMHIHCAHACAYVCIQTHKYTFVHTHNIHASKSTLQK